MTKNQYRTTNYQSLITALEGLPQRLAHPIDLRLFHPPRERQRQAASPQVLGDGEVSLLIAKLLPHVALQMDRREVRPSRDTVRLHLLRNAVPPEFSVEAHHIDEPAHAGRRRGLWDRPRPRVIPPGAPHTSPPRAGAWQAAPRCAAFGTGPAQRSARPGGSCSRGRCVPARCLPARDPDCVVRAPAPPTPGGR